MRTASGVILMLAGFGGALVPSPLEPGVRVLLALIGLAGLLRLTVRRVRWLVAIVLCAAITNSYIDRGTLSLAVNHIRDSGDIAISDTDFAHLNSAFLFAYAAMYIGGGKLMDLLGTRRGYLVITVFWSLAVMCHGFVQSLAGLMLCRFLLGVGEGGGFPGITKAVAEWFPARERSTAVGLINAGTALGGMISPPLAALILTSHHWPGAQLGLDDPWRWIFFLSGSLGLVWCVWWMWVYQPARLHSGLSAREKEEIQEVLSAEQATAAQPPIPWLSLLADRRVWGLMLCKFLGDAVWYFITFWLPKYLMDVHAYDIKKVAIFTWMPWAAAGVGCIVVGSFSSWLIARGLSLNTARKTALGVAVSVMPCLLLLTVIQDKSWIILPFVIAYFGQQAWSTMVMTLPADLFPRSSVGAVAGLVGFGGAMGGIVFGELSGWYLKSHPKDYGPIFSVASVLHVLSFLVILAMIPRVERRPIANS